MTRTVPAKSIPTNLNKRVICKLKNFYNLLAFLLIAKTLLIAVRIYGFIKYQGKQKHFLPLHDVSIKKINTKIYLKNGK